MKDSLWIVVVVTMVFISFLLGYSVPPLIESGMIGGNGTQAGVNTELDVTTEDYYRNLLEEK